MLPLIERSKTIVYSNTPDGFFDTAISVLSVIACILSLYCTLEGLKAQFERAQLFFDALGLTAKVVISEMTGLRFETEQTRKGSYMR